MKIRCTTGTQKPKMVSQKVGSRIIEWCGQANEGRGQGQGEGAVQISYIIHSYRGLDTTFGLSFSSLILGATIPYPHLTSTNKPPIDLNFYLNLTSASLGISSHGSQRNRRPKPRVCKPWFPNRGSRYSTKQSLS